MNIRRLFAVWSAKFIKTACQITGRQGVTLAGKIALSIYPPILKELAGEVRKDIFVVCGTNGKTTTNNLLASVLEADKCRVVCNRTGSNRTAKYGQKQERGLGYPVLFMFCLPLVHTKHGKRHHVYDKQPGGYEFYHSISFSGILISPARFL